MFQIIEPKDLLKGVINIDYILIDVRSKDEAVLDTIPGAKSIPYSDLEDRVSEIPFEKKVIFMCNNGKQSGMARNYVMATTKRSNFFALNGGIRLYKSYLEASKAG